MENESIRRDLSRVHCIGRRSIRYTRVFVITLMVLFENILFVIIVHRKTAVILIRTTILILHLKIKLVSVQCQANIEILYSKSIETVFRHNICSSAFPHILQRNVIKLAQHRSIMILQKQDLRNTYLLRI